MLRFDGHILGASFASGHRLVVGRWFEGPFGAFADVMWRRPDGERLLLASTEEAADFISSHYTFDRVVVVPVAVDRFSGDQIRIHAAASDVALVLNLRLRAPGAASWVLRLQPAALRERPGWIDVLDRTVRPLLGPVLYGGSRTRVHGRTRAGVEEWYAIRDYRTADATATDDGADVGPLGASPPAGFGFSEFPDGAVLVRVTSLFAD